MSFAKTLNRDEMKNVMAGDKDPVVGGECCLRCDQSNHECDAKVSDLLKGNCRTTL